MVPEHVELVLERHGEELVTGDGGKTDAKGNPCSQMVRRTINVNRISGPFGASTCVWRLSLGG